MGMIKSEQELSASKKLLSEINLSISTAKPNPDVKKIFFDNGLISLKVFGQDIEDQISEYENIKQGNIPKALFGIENLGLLLIALRIKNGLTQTELAARLGVAQSQVSRDENNDYHGVTLPTVIKILKALNENVETILK